MKVLKILITTLMVFLLYDTISYLFEAGKSENRQLELVENIRIEDTKAEDAPNAVPALAFVAFVSSAAAFFVGRYLWKRRDHASKAAQDTTTLAVQEVVQFKRETSSVACDTSDDLQGARQDEETSGNDQEVAVETLELIKAVPESSSITREELPINIQVKCECSLLSFEDRMRVVESALAATEELTRCWSIKIEKTETDILELQKQVDELLSESKSSVQPEESEAMTVGDGIPVFRRDNYYTIKTLADLIAETKKQITFEDQKRSIGTQSDSRVNSAEDLPTREEVTEEQTEPQSMVSKVKTVTILLPGPENLPNSSLRARETAICREIDDLMTGLEEVTARPCVGNRQRRQYTSTAFSQRKLNEELGRQKSLGWQNNRYKHVNSRYLLPRNTSCHTTTVTPPASAEDQQPAANLPGQFKLISSRSPMRLANSRFKQM